MKSTIIMMCGCCGSGKSTFSKKKEKEEGYIRLSIDEMVWEKYGRHGIDYPVEKYREILDNTDKELRQKLSELIIQGKNIVIDSSFWRKSTRESYRDFIEQVGINEGIVKEIQLIYLKSDYETLKNRLKIRNQSINANSPFEITNEILDHHFNGFQEPLNENEIIILQK
ncbi:hypothetical protein DDB_G0281831 [Dictyostelium discoideum AX4]|uniref:ATP-binding protein n=1 Tax=Dictyostelium discoideum TaxID=44689 RepID=Q54TE2_DICDI|nr:hypothetical protein DDB_G0281831 [Dictyostelium discoideum AX4]EAL66475.1 hypothetical protein DDB_G0281831 [Dictyostelium discoideum AX4]|eukprot:XP_640447.1 hypothetical protein DDB_G0281831 [Dictyostelium discoideum AX4]